MGAPEELSPQQVATMTDPVALLERAWVLEPWGRYAERKSLLDRLEELLDLGQVPPSPPGRDWRLELVAERAVDLSRMHRAEETIGMAETVLREADPSNRIARGRAQLAAGQALAWTGTDAATARADRAFSEAEEHFAALGNREWHGSALLRHGYSAWFQGAGDLRRAKQLIGEALQIWEPESERLASSYTYYAEVLIDLGELDAAEQALDQAQVLAERDGNDKALGELAETRACLAAAVGDVRATERFTREAIREASRHEWFDTHMGTSALLQAAQLLDRVGLAEQSLEYFERARTRAGEEDSEVLQVRAARLARFGDPTEALEVLQRMVRYDWLEKRLVWRHLLLTAWATFRTGRVGAGEVAARAFDHAVACGGVQIAQSGEPILSRALAALAEQSGSAAAREMLLEGRPLLVRLFGTPTVTQADGTPLTIPVGKPGELVRMLALHESGRPVEVVVDHFFPDAPLAVGRSRLRQVLTRLRAAAGDVVVRDGDHLRLLPAWVDVREFIIASDRVRASRGAMAVQLAYAALALCTAEFLPSDRYAGWADEVRARVEYRYIELLEMVATDAARRGSHQEALTAFDALLMASPDQAYRYSEIVDQLRGLGRQGTAEYLVGRADSTDLTG